MRAATELLCQYATCHRDRRNITSHFVGVPLIGFAVGVILARPAFALDGVALSTAWIAFGFSAAWFLTRGDFTLGLAVSAGTAVLMLLAHQVACSSVAAWLAWGMGGFAAGWLIQFVGHWYEGGKPAFVDDVVGLLVGPMFVTAEAMFMLGWNKPLMAEIERRAGPTHMRDLARVA